MEEKKVREIIKYFKKEIDFAERRKSDCSEIMLSVFEDEIDTGNIVIEALEKQLSKKPTYEGDGYASDGTFIWDEWLCPNCGSRYEVDYDDYGYCPNCGQRIDWEEEENERT